jgi:hypothetical protein
MRKRLLPIAALIAAALLCVPAAADAAKRKVPPKFYGTMWDKQIQDASPQIYEQQFATMAVSGVEAVRVIFSWNLAQETQGQTTFRYTDPMIEYSARHGIEALPVVTYAPPWARVQPNELGSAPSNHQAYADFLKLLIARYGPGGQFWDEHPDVPYRPVRYWQIWNEPGVQYQWSPQANWPEKYGELLRLVYPTVKQADPGAKVVLAGLVNASWDEIDALYARGGVKGSFDIAAVHYYARLTHQFLEVSRRFRASLDKHGDRRMPIWWTEVGASASRGIIASPGNEHFQTTDKALAPQLTKTYRLFIRYRNKLRIQRVYWYTWASSYSPNAGAFDFSGMNVFDGQTVTPKPSLAAYRKSARTHEGCKKDARARCVRRR